MNANVSRLLNEQINKEFYSAYLYLDFAQLLRRRSDWTALRTGTGYRRRRNGITPCCFISICRITARASPLRLSQSRSGNEATTWLR